ncbi:MAG TPA: UDP-N-acetylmuramoyl-L-alanine--D-glutamate ligase [Desulfurivibrionaceae bacterium]|nr:UDP-N-acetylmuramoyl-L-alanine--D-glutamate ligase [Desulfurivibrionaceae bacterium]
MDAREIVEGLTPDSRVVVVGLGRSGMAAVRLLRKMGVSVAVSEATPREKLDPENLSWLAAHAISVECGGHSADLLSGADLLVVSPGVPLDLPQLRDAAAAGVPVLGELALACAMVETPIVAITGTNGKSTVTELVGEMFRAAEMRVFVGGNLGTPLSEYLLGEQDCEVLVLEVSSFQLDTAPGFAPEVAVLLNISPDHLDRYPDYEAYAASKFSIFGGQKPSSAAILNRDDDELMQRMAGYQVPGRQFFYGDGSGMEGRGAAISGSEIIASGLTAGELEHYSLAGTSLGQEPNVHNGAAAILAARLLGCPAAAVRQALAGFRPLQHRLALVAEINGVQFFDDSKATNIGAVAAALRGMSRPVVLIGGGRDKGGDYALLHDLVREKVKGMVLVGEAREKMAASFAQLTRVEVAAGLGEAVTIASRLAEAGDAVLLSPACASFDMFSGYAQRGLVFRAAVAALANAREAK